MAIDLQSLLSPPAVLQQNLNTSLPNTTYGAPSLGSGIMDRLGGAFRADPNGSQNVATHDPGVISGLFPQGSGAQNFLGRLGDAFLIANGHEPIHRQFAQQQAEGQALGPLSTDHPMDAVTGLAKVNPTAAINLHNQVVQEQLAQAQRAIASAQLQRQNRLADTQIDNEKIKIGNAGLSFLAAANPQNYPQVKQRILDFWQSRGIDPNDMPALPDSYDKDAVTNVQMAGVPVTRQFQNAETAEHHRALEDIGQQNAVSNRVRAGAQATSAGAQVTSAGARAQEAGTGASRLQNDILGGKTGPNTVHGGGGHHVFGGAGAAPVAGIVSPPPFAPGKAGRTVTNGTHTFISPDGKTWNLKQ